MNIMKITLFFVISAGLSFSLANAAGDVAKGKILFNEPKLGSGTTGNSCNSCHPNGKGLQKAAGRKDLPKVINACIENALKGKSIDPKSAEMADLIAYINSLKGSPERPAEKGKS